MYKALIIDDEKPVQIAIQKLGHWRQYHMDPPQLAVNGKDGLSAMREFHPDIVFVDMNMPVMDGASFLMKASQEFPASQYIVVSGCCGGRIERCHREGAFTNRPCCLLPAA